MKLGKILNNIYVKNLIAIALTLLILVFVALWWLDDYTQHGKSVVIPDVKGMQVDTAGPIFANSQLQYEVVDSIFDQNLTPGSIVETIPPIGSRVKEGRIIFLTTNSITSKQLVVPEVIDFSQRQAIAILKSAGFEQINVKSVPGIYRDLVIGIEKGNFTVNAGDRVPIQTVLTLLVSSGNGEENPFAEDSVIIENTPEETWY